VTADSKPAVRVAGQADVARIVAITNAAFLVETFMEGDRTNPGRVMELMGQGAFLVAESDGAVVASVYTEIRALRGYFGMLAVDPALKGRGWGRLMIDAAEERFREHGCRGVDIIVLSLREDLPPYYAKLGYRETRREPFKPDRAVKDGFECQALILSKDLLDGTRAVRHRSCLL
jgi:ribosomal protein S18 acetylase RimI-like enzyme